MSTMMHPKDVVAAVGKRGTNLVQLALSHNLSRSALHYALLRPSRRAEEVLARFLGLPPKTIWPTRYAADGTRIITRGRRKPATRASNISDRGRTRGQ